MTDTSVLTNEILIFQLPKPPHAITLSPKTEATKSPLLDGIGVPVVQTPEIKHQFKLIL